MDLKWLITIWDGYCFSMIMASLASTGRRHLWNERKPTRSLRCAPDVKQARYFKCLMSAVFLARPWTRAWGFGKISDKGSNKVTKKIPTPHDCLPHDLSWLKLWHVSPHVRHPYIGKMVAPLSIRDKNLHSDWDSEMSNLVLWWLPQSFRE